MIIRLKLPLVQNEYSALMRLALSELRDPESQARHIIKKELERRGLLMPDLVTENATNQLQAEKSSVVVEDE